MAATAHHVAITCKGPLLVERFYTKHFGFKRARVIDLGSAQIVFIKLGSLYLEIFGAKEEAPMPPPANDGFPWPGWRHIALKVDDVDATLAAMGAEANVKLGPMSFDSFIQGWRSAWLADPEGNIVEISQGYVDQDNPPPLK